MDQRSYTALPTRKLAEELESRAERVPIDMANVEISARSLSHVLADSDESNEGELRSVAIGYLLLLDALKADFERKLPPRAEDGDVIFANRSWSPGKRFGTLLADLYAATKAAEAQRRSAMERAGLTELPAHDHRRDTRDELETHTQNEAVS